MSDRDAPDGNAPAHNASAHNAPAPGAVDPRLLDILVCPQTKGPLTFDREKSELISKTAMLAYPVRDGVPIMLVDEARPLSDDEVV